MNTLLAAIDTPLKVAHDAREELFRALTAPAEALHRQWENSLRSMNPYLADDDWRDYASAAASIRQLEAIASVSPNAHLRETVRYVTQQEQQIEAIVAACRPSIADALAGPADWVKQAQGFPSGMLSTPFDSEALLMGTASDLAAIGLSPLALNPMDLLDPKPRPRRAPPYRRFHERSPTAGNEEPADPPGRAAAPTSARPSNPPDEAAPSAIATSVPTTAGHVQAPRFPGAIPTVSVEAMMCLFRVGAVLCKATGQPWSDAAVSKDFIFRSSLQVAARHPRRAACIVMLVTSFMGVVDRMDAPCGSTRSGCEEIDGTDLREMEQLAQELCNLLAGLTEARR